MICRICNGSGFFFAIQPNNVTKLRQPIWFSCPSCNGLGTLNVIADAKIRMKNKLGKKLVKINKEIDFKESLTAKK